MSESPLAPLLVLLDGAERPALAELEHALARRLHDSLDPAAERVAELGFLSLLLEEAKPFPRPRQEIPGRGRRAGRAMPPPRLERAEYERWRAIEAPDAPAAHLLVERYGSWLRARRAAYGLRSDGRSVAASNPWAQPLRGTSRPPRYGKEEVRSAIRRCAFALGRIPSAADYKAWTSIERRRARERGSGERNEGGHPLLPALQTIYRLYKTETGTGRWRAALADAHLTEAEIKRARDEHLGLGAEKNSRRRPGEEVLRLSLSEAIELAAREKVSLDWLAGLAASEGKAPAPGFSFAPERISALRKERGLSERALREALRLQLGPWRRLLGGQLEPTLGQLAVLAMVLGVEVAALARAAATP